MFEPISHAWHPYLVALSVTPGAITTLLWHPTRRRRLLDPSGRTVDSDSMGESSNQCAII